jgi:hypothetical protein
MSLSGSGDDTKAMRDLTEALRKAIASVVHDPQRVAQANGAVGDLERAFAAHRDRLAQASTCIEKADRSYEATREQYETCDQDNDARWTQTIDGAIAADKQLRASVHDDEWPQLRAAFAGEKP